MSNDFFQKIGLILCIKFKLRNEKKNPPLDKFVVQSKIKLIYSVVFEKCVPT